jgi:hypothetical protein
VVLLGCTICVECECAEPQQQTTKASTEKEGEREREDSTNKAKNRETTTYLLSVLLLLSNIPNDNDDRRTDRRTEPEVAGRHRWCVLSAGWWRWLGSRVEAVVLKV